MNHGTRPVAPHPKQYSFPLTFGTVNTFPDEFNPPARVLDQNADGLPMGCTAETVRQSVFANTDTDPNPNSIYDLTRKAEGTYPQIVGCDLKTAYKTATVYFEQAPYFEVHPENGLDYFDSMRSALLVAHNIDGKYHSFGAGNPWLPEFLAGIVEGYSYDGNPKHYSWHADNICGWSLINGEPRIAIEVHQGEKYGDKGFIRLNREQFNRLFDEWGTIILKQMAAKPEDIQKRRLTMIEYALHFIPRLISLGGYNEAFSDLVALLKYLNL